MERHEAVLNVHNIATGIPKSKCVRGTPDSIKKKLPESDRARRSAVDEAALRYLGALAKKDSEGFVYPSTATIAKKICRTPFYVSQRIHYLEKIGRLIPAKRERHNRIFNGWIVLRYKSWVDAQMTENICQASDPMHVEPENHLAGRPNNFVKAPNCLAETEGPKAPNLLSLQGNPADGDRWRSGLDLSIVYDGDRRSLSQFTRTATATAATESSQSSERKQRKIKPSLSDRLASKISREQSDLKTFSREFGDYPQFLENIHSISKFLAFPFAEDDPTVSWDFCAILGQKWDEFESRLHTGDMEPSAFCSKVIDHCHKEHIIWPPSFDKHRHRLRLAEKADQIKFYVREHPDGLERRTRIDEESLNWN